MIDNLSGPCRPTLAAGASRRASTVRDLRRELAISRRRLAEAEAALAAVAKRDHELHNLRPTAVGPVLRDLAAVHGASGTDVHVMVEGDPVAAVDGSTLAQVIANLLVNCARHAPGATVWMRARRAGDRVCIEVTDDGPGLPAGAEEALLGQAVPGPRSSGSGLGLAIAADLLRARGGSVTLRSPGRGVTAVVELPSASRARSTSPDNRPVVSVDGVTRQWAP